jgi:uncharacterized membrane protein YcaP (DUF421 family)
MNDYQLTDWQRILLGETPWHFLVEVLGRTLVMFAVIFTALRATGKRTVRQLSVFELVLIIGLGSAAGDPMFYHDVGLLPALLVFLVVILSYRTLTHWASQSPKVEELVEGKAVCLIDEGEFSIDDFEKEDLGLDEFFMEMRLAGVEHLGQVRKAYLESNGGISLYFYEDTDVKPGLPIRPDVFAKKSNRIPFDGDYACAFCGNVETLRPNLTDHFCDRCHRTEWVGALRTRRVV